MKKELKKFYTKSLDERWQALKDANLIDSLDKPELKSDKSDVMVENYIMNFQLPLGLAFNFQIDGKDFVIPMAIEEPSVIAAASNGAKILGNIETSMGEKAVIGQIVLTDIDDLDFAINNLNASKEYLLDEASKLCPSMIKRGGGPKKIWIDRFEEDGRDFISFYLSIDTCDAMGANTINTILEAITEDVEALTKSKHLMRIISNNATESIVKAKARIDISRLNEDPKEAEIIAERIEQASIYSNLDPYRASTHNKGIMNGIDAVLLATGNDWRAIEAGAHCYAARSGKYKALTSWTYKPEDRILEGEIELPLAVASVGGTISSNEIARWSLDLLGEPSAKRLARIVAAVGLSQNFSAIRAIVTEGIQKGHMSLHARSVAKEAGARADEIQDLVDLLKKEEKINLIRARDLLEELRKTPGLGG